MEDYSRSFVCLAVVTLILTGCSTSGPVRKVSSEPLRSQVTDGAPVVEDIGFNEWNVRPSNEVAPGYEIRISGSQDSRINGVFRIDSDGALSLPLDVKIDANGLNLDQLQDRVRSAYKRYLRSPKMRLTVERKEYYVEVRGLVNKPGSYLVRPDSSLDEVIAAAGGLKDSVNPMAVPNYARISQLGVTNILSLRDYFGGSEQTRDRVPAWQGGDQIFLQSEAPAGLVASALGGYVLMVGEIRHPGEYAYEKQSDFFDYLVRAGGPTDRANLDKVQILRVTGGRRDTIEFRVDELESIPAIRPGDSVVLRAENPSYFEKQTRVIGGVASIISTFATLVLIFLAT